tara:strand:+ start:796 stop:1005 length:210 start_codon:yes stop_codon:yes gene_type:complete
MYNDKRPRLNEALTKMKAFQMQGFSEATEALDLYDDILEKAGQWAAGHYIIELAISIDNNLQELQDAKG